LTKVLGRQISEKSFIKFSHLLYKKKIFYEFLTQNNLQNCCEFFEFCQNWNLGAHKKYYCNKKINVYINIYFKYFILIPKNLRNIRNQYNLQEVGSRNICFKKSDIGKVTIISTFLYLLKYYYR